MNESMALSVRRMIRLCFWLAFASTPTGQAAERVDNTLRPEGTMMVPDTFLRSWDPVTVFFDRAKGAGAGKPENNPDMFLRVEPNHPGAYTWLNDRTLQFRPAESWPPLTKYRWTVAGKVQTLNTLMAAPLSSEPGNGARDLNPVEDITLTFAAPVDPLALKKMLRIELRELPGIDTNNAFWLKPDDFDIKVIERSNRNQNAAYVISLSKPIASGFMAKIHLRLSLDDSVDESFHEISFFTAKPFEIDKLGCPGNFYPITASGSRYVAEQAIQCGSTNRIIQVRFSAPLNSIDPIAARNLIHITPMIENASYSASGKVLTVRGEFKTEQIYQVNLEPGLMLDTRARALNINGRSELFLFFPAQPSFLNWEASQGVMERLGPQMLPLKGRGFKRMDLRIHPVDPTDRSFWPFPLNPIRVDEQQRPPAPGEKVGPYTNRKRNISNLGLSRQIKALGAPSVSEIVSIPLPGAGNAAKFGLDLKPYLERINGVKKPGAYLVGMRILDNSTQRSWVRVQVTDLSLSTIREPERVRFVVTSLQTGQPVTGARIVVEGNSKNILQAVTDGQGQYSWRIPRRQRDNVRRIMVKKDDDMLVLDPNSPPQTYANNLWQQKNNNWLGWTQSLYSGYQEQGQDLCHVFTERPVYKAEDLVHIKGYLRNVVHGNFRDRRPNKARLVINGPGNLEWIYPLEVGKFGSFYHAFKEDKLPTGKYTANFVYKGGQCGAVTFMKEAYRLPKFEVQLTGPDKTGLDAAFEVKLSTEYYAGGNVIERPVRWRVTQFPYSWSPKKREGFFYSTDARFSKQGRFRGEPLSYDEALTDEFGGASISIDPTIELSAHARRYVIEATVTGADDQSVSSTFETRALPPLVIGLKVPRYTQSLNGIDAEILVTDQNGKSIVGQPITLRLQQRQWHSYLQAGDYSQGVGKYVTEVVDTKIFETSIAAESDISKVSLPIEQAGVYIVEIETVDKIGRLQTVKVDMFAGGDQPVTWSRQPTQVFKVTPEKKSYAPGEIARLILQSPYQRARVLAIVEQPDGLSRYEWLNVKNGAATYEVPINKVDMPRLPVHFMLVRGRIKASKTSNIDLGKPSTLAATTLIEVSTIEHQVAVEMDYPTTVQPGDEIEVSIKLSDENGKPLSGEVTLWLVDQSVLALGKEQRIDPLPDFIPNRDSYTSLHDSRNLTLGFFPYQEQPGGGESEMRTAEPNALLDNVTVRKNFNPVPYFNPNIFVNGGGSTSVKFNMPDNLTNFKVRAKVVSGADRFGYHTGQLAVRLPVIVQPSLPRFVRPGDSFTAIAIGRVVEGDSGPGRAQVEVDGLKISGNKAQTFDWDKTRPQRIEFQMSVPTPTYNAAGEIELDKVKVTLAVERSSDNARDAFQVELPIRLDRKAVKRREILSLSGNKTQTLAAITEPVREGTLQRLLLVSSQPELIRMSAGLNYLLEYPHGCTEQRLSRSRAVLASSKFDSLLNKQSAAGLQDKVVNDTLEWLAQVKHENGLIGYWPGSSGYVSLTAWSTMFLIEARSAGYAIDQAMFDQMIRALKSSMRSDYSYYINGAAYSERSWALAALAMAGEAVSGYAAELARQSQYLNLESLSQVVVALRQGNQYSEKQLQALYKKLWASIVFRLHRGEQVYGGLQSTALSDAALILPSETRAVAEALRAVSLTPDGLQSDMPVEGQQQLIDAIVGLGKGDGWGSTNANAAALLSLSEVLTAKKQARGPLTVVLHSVNKKQTITLDQQAIASTTLSHGDALTLSLQGSADGPIVVMSDTRYTPALDGSHVIATANGFVVSREMQKILGDGQPPQRSSLDSAAQSIPFDVGDIVEEHVEVINPKDAYHVAVIVPLAAGMEALNPALATAPPEAKPNGQLTRLPSYVAFMDDQMAYYYDTLPKGSYHFYFRTQATIPGSYIQPAAQAEMMYDQTVNGQSFGARVVISKKP